MELDWSAQSPHIRSLFHPWQPSDGYDEETIQAAEARLAVRLPPKLRDFYLAWGRRRDLTRMQNPLLPPDELEIQEDTLLFWVENQAVFYWGVPCEAVEEDDPPVVIAASGLERLRWKPSHVHLSSFLDDMTYFHAFCGGAIHGAWIGLYDPHNDLTEDQVAWLDGYWNKATVTTLALGIDSDPVPTLYVRDGQAFWLFHPYSLAAREAEAIDEIGQRFQIKWKHRW